MSESLLDCCARLENVPLKREGGLDAISAWVKQQSSIFLLQNILRLAFVADSSLSGNTKVDEEVIILACDGCCSYRPFPIDIDIAHLVPAHDVSAVETAFNARTKSECDSCLDAGRATAAARRKLARLTFLHVYFHQLKLPSSACTDQLMELFFAMMKCTEGKMASSGQQTPRLLHIVQFWVATLPIGNHTNRILETGCDVTKQLSSSLSTLDVESLYLHAVLAAHVLPRLPADSSASDDDRLCMIIATLMESSRSLADPVLASFVSLLIDCLPLKFRRKLWGTPAHCELILSSRSSQKLDDNARLFDTFCLLRCPSIDGTHVFGALRMADSPGKFTQRGGGGTIFTTTITLPRRYTANQIVAFVPREVNNPHKRFIRRRFDPPAGPDDRATIFGDVLHAVNFGPSPQVFYFEICVTKIAAALPSEATAAHIAIGVGRGFSLLRTRDASKLKYGRKIYAMVNNSCRTFSPKQLRHVRRANFGVDDVIGCGIYRNRLFFTLNGRLLREQCVELEMTFTPFVDLPGQAIVSVNFGDNPYVFDLRKFLAVRERLLSIPISKISFHFTAHERQHMITADPFLSGSELSLPLAISILEAASDEIVPTCTSASTIWRVMLEKMPSHEIQSLMLFHLVTPISNILLPRTATNKGCCRSSFVVIDGDEHQDREYFCEAQDLVDLREYQQRTNKFGVSLAMLPSIDTTVAFRRSCCAVVLKQLLRLKRCQQNRRSLKKPTEGYDPEPLYVSIPHVLACLPHIVDWFDDLDDRSCSGWLQPVQLLHAIGLLLVPSSRQHDPTLFCCIVSCIQQMFLRFDQGSARHLALIEVFLCDDCDHLGPAAEIACALLGANTLALLLMPGDLVFHRRPGGLMLPARIVSSEMFCSSVSIPGRGSLVMPHNVVRSSSCREAGTTTAVVASRLIAKRRLPMCSVFELTGSNDSNGVLLLERLVETLLRLLRAVTAAEEQQYENWTVAGRRASETARPEPDERFSRFDDDAYGRNRLEQLVIAQDHMPVSWFQWAVTTVLATFSQSEIARTVMQRHDLVGVLCAKWLPTTNPLRFMWNYECTIYGAASSSSSASQRKFSNNICIAQEAYADLLHRRSPTAARQSTLLNDLINSEPQSSSHASRKQATIGTKRVWLAAGAKLDCGPCIECGRSMQPMFTVFKKGKEDDSKRPREGYCAGCILGIPMLVDVTNEIVAGPQKHWQQLPRKVFVRCSCCAEYLTSQLDSFAVKLLRFVDSRWSKRELAVDMCFHCASYNCLWYDLDPDSALGGCSFEDFHPLNTLRDSSHRKDTKTNSAKATKKKAVSKAKSPFTQARPLSEDDLEDEDDCLQSSSSYHSEDDDDDLNNDDDEVSSAEFSDMSGVTDEVTRSPWNLARELLEMVDFDSFASSHNFVLFKMKHAALESLLALIGRASCVGLNDVTLARVCAAWGTHWPSVKCILPEFSYLTGPNESQQQQQIIFVPCNNIMMNRIFLRIVTETMHTLMIDDQESPPPFGCAITLGPREVAHISCAATRLMTMTLIHGDGPSLNVKVNRSNKSRTPFLFTSSLHAPDAQIYAESGSDVFTFSNHHTHDVLVVYCRFFRTDGTPRDDVPLRELFLVCDQILGAAKSPLIGLSGSSSLQLLQVAEDAQASLVFALSAHDICSAFWVHYFPRYICRLYSLGLVNVSLSGDNMIFAQHVLADEIGHRHDVLATCVAWELLNLTTTKCNLDNAISKKKKKIASSSSPSNLLSHLPEAPRLAFVPQTFSLSHLAQSAAMDCEPVRVVPTMISMNFDVDAVVEQSDHSKSVTVIPEIVGDRHCAVTAVSSCYAMYADTNNVKVDFSYHPSFRTGVRCVTTTSSSCCDDISTHVSECSWSVTGLCRSFDGGSWESSLRVHHNDDDETIAVTVTVDISKGEVEITLCNQLPLSKGAKKKIKKIKKEQPKLSFVIPSDISGSHVLPNARTQRRFYLIVHSSQEFTVEFTRWTQDYFPCVAPYSPVQPHSPFVWDRREIALAEQLSETHRKIASLISRSGGIGIDEVPLECAKSQGGITDEAAFRTLRVFNNCLTCCMGDIFWGFPVFRQFVADFAKRIILLTSSLRHFISQELEKRIDIINLHLEAHARPVVVVDRIQRQQHQDQEQQQSTEPSHALSSFSSSGSIFKQVAKQLLQFSAKMEFFVSDERWFDVELLGEGGGDAGGPFRDVLNAITDELFSMKRLHQQQEGLFLPTPNTLQQNGSEVGSFYPNPCSGRYDLFYLLGKMMAGCAFCRCAKMSFNLNSLCWKFLAGEPITSNESTLSAFDWQLVTSLTSLRSVDVLSELCIEVDQGEGVLVTDLPSVEALILSRLSSTLDSACGPSNTALWWMRRGLHELIPEDVMLFMNGALLEYYVCGTTVVPTSEDFGSKLCVNHGSDVVNPSVLRAVETFRSAIRFLTPDELVLLLQFWTAHARFPVPGLFLEIDEGMSADTLPTSRTCFYELTIPAAVGDNLELCLSKLRHAIHHCVSIDRDFDPHTFGA